MDRKLDELLNDQFLQILQKEDFNSAEYISNLIQTSDIENLIELLINYQNKEREINCYLEDFSLKNQNFLKKQFKLPDLYGSCFDQIKNTVTQSQRKIRHSKEIFNYNSNKLKLLKSEIFEISTVLEELLILDKLNEDLLDIAIFMKKELFLQSSTIFIKIREKMKTLKKNEEKNSTINYFEAIVDKKKKEFLYLLKERLFNMIFDVFVEQYNKDNFLIFEQKNVELDLNFETENLNYKYFEDFIKNYSHYNLECYNEDNCLNTNIFNKKFFKLDEMIELYFDTSVFSFLNKEIENSINIYVLEDFKLIELMKAAHRVELLEILLKDFWENLDFKLTKYFLKYSKFLVYIFKNNKNLTKFNMNKNLDFHNDYFILFNLRNIEFNDIFINCLMKLIVILWQRVAFIFKIADNFDRKALEKILECFFDKLKIYLENSYFEREMITSFNHDIFELSNVLRKKFEFNYTHLYICLNKIGPHFQLLIEQFCAFIGQAEKSKVIKMYYEKFEDSIFFKIKLKILQIYENKVFVKNAFNKVEKKDIQIRNKSKEDFDFNTNMSEIVKQSNNINSKFFEGIVQKKYCIEIINNFNKFCKDLNFFLQTNLSRDHRMYKQFLQLYNRTLLDVFKTMESNILSKKKFKEISKFQKEGYFRQNIKKLKVVLFETKNKENFTKTRLESFLDIPDSFDYSQINIKQFWIKQNRIEFYEKAFICFDEFFNNEKSILDYLLKMWDYLDVKTLNELSLSLNITFELENPLQDLKTAYQSIERSSKIGHLVQKIEARVDLTFIENITLVIYYYFKFRDLILDLLFFLKFNFDYLIYSFFEESSKSLDNLEEQDKIYFNVSNQVFEFKKLMMSFNKMTKNYIRDEVLQKYFILNSLDYFYKRFHKFIFEIKPIFIENNKLIKTYYQDFSNILASMDIMKFYHQDIIDKSENYKLMKDLLTVENIDNLEEIGITFGLEENAQEFEYARQSILLYSQITMPKTPKKIFFTVLMQQLKNK